MSDPVLAVVTARSKRHITLSTIVLTLTLVATIVVALFAMHQRDVQKAEFERNSNLQLIEISGVDTGNGFTELTSHDMAEIPNYIPEHAPAVVSELLGFGTGFETSDSDSYFLFGISPEISDILGLSNLAENTVYSTASSEDAAGPETKQSGAESPLELTIPVITSSDGNGVTAGDSEKTTFTLSNKVDPTKFRYLTGGVPGNTGYITSQTYWTIAHTMLGMTQPEIDAAVEDQSLGMIPVYSGALVLVKDINHVREVAGALEDQGYIAEYALDAFSSIESELDRQNLMIRAIVAFTILSAITLFVTTWRSYVALSRRDIGILKHWKVQDRTIANLYGRVLLRMLAIPVFTSIALTVVLSFILFPPLTAGVRIAVISTLLVVAAAGIYWLVQTLIVRRQVSNEVLDLLERERQFQ